MSTISVLLLILLVLMILVGHKQGWQSFISLILNFIYFFIALVLITFHVHPLIVALIMGLIILATTIFMAIDNLTVSVTAFTAAVIVMIVVTLMIILVEHWAQAPGFSNEDSGELEGMSVMIGINYLQVGVVITIMSALGAVAEAAMAVTTGLQEVLQSNKKMSEHEMVDSGLQIGRQIIGTTLNTLFFGFFGGFLALFVWFFGLNYSFGTIINNKIFCAEIIAILISFIGVVLVIPVATILVIRSREKMIDK